MSESAGPTGGFDEGDTQQGGDGAVQQDGPGESSAGSALWVHLALFGATCVTTTFWGALYAGAGWGDWWRGLAYSGPLMAILLTHEMGHYIAARRHHIAVSLPYFIPFPFGLGTLGAVISMKDRIRSRNALVDVGAAGPLAGFVVAVVVLAVGLAQSPVGPIPPGSALASEGNSILYFLMKRLIVGEWLPMGGRDVFLTPTALAGWIGFLITMINLIPIGQLDGGHVAFAYFGDRYESFCRKLHHSLPVLALVVMAYVTYDNMHQVAPSAPELLEPRWRMWPLVTWKQAAQSGFFAAFPWLLWPALLSGLKKMGQGQYHPPVGDEPLSPGRRAVAVIVGLLFLLIFTPVPMVGS